MVQKTMVGIGSDTASLGDVRLMVVYRRSALSRFDGSVMRSSRSHCKKQE